jgi:3'-phosphoadenosine 5'-phosphosulfate synthase
MTSAVTVTELFVAEADKAAKVKAAAAYPKFPLNKVSCEWLQVLSEGWASPLKGFMRENEFLQCIHFNAIKNGDKWHSQSVPIVLDCDAEMKAKIEGQEFVTLTYEGVDMAILKNPEVYEHVKQERICRTFGLCDKGHPYADQIWAAGDFLVGGDLEVLNRIVWNDGLDKYRKTPNELRAEFKARGSDAIYAFQLRNPVHNGHALLMQDTHQKLVQRGFKKPTLLLHPLGGYTKNDDVPLDVRMKQHDCVLAEKVLDPENTVLAIFPSPMIYAGPTEVQWHAKAREVAGATFYIVGRDPAGMSHPVEDRDMFLAHHGRQVLSMAPGLDTIEIIPFKFAAYDNKKVSDRPGNPLGAMNFWDDSRPGDFTKISGSKMRKFAREGVTPPDGYMCPTGWTVVANFYKEKAAKAAAEAAAAEEPAAKKAKTA